MHKMNTNIATLNNYIKRLKDKKALVNFGDGLKVSSNILEALNDNQVNITFNIIDDVN